MTARPNEDTGLVDITTAIADAVEELGVDLAAAAALALASLTVLGPDDTLIVRLGADWPAADVGVSATVAGIAKVLDQRIGADRWLIVAPGITIEAANGPQRPVEPSDDLPLDCYDRELVTRLKGLTRRYPAAAIAGAAIALNKRVVEFGRDTVLIGE